MLSVFMCVCDYCKYFVEIKAALPPPVQIISDLSKKFNAGEQKFNT